MKKKEDDEVRLSLVGSEKSIRDSKSLTKLGKVEQKSNKRRTKVEQKSEKSNKSRTKVSQKSVKSNTSLTKVGKVEQYILSIIPI